MQRIKELNLKTVLGIVLFASLMTWLLFRVSAATPFASLEPESASLSSGATVASDSSATGGSFVEFNTARESPPSSGPAYRSCVSNKPTGGNHYYIATDGSDSNDGSQGSPWKTLHHAVTKVLANNNNTIHLGSGTFSETGSAVVLPSGINLVGTGRRTTIYKGLIKINDGTKNQTISSMKFDGWENKNASVSKYTALDLGATSYCVTVHDILVEGFYGFAVRFGGEQFEFYDSELRNNGKQDARGHATKINGLKDSYLHDFVMVEEAGKGGEGMGGGISNKMTNVEFYNMTIISPNSKEGGWCKVGGACQVPFNIEFFNMDSREVDIHDSTFNSKVSLIQWQPRRGGPPRDTRIKPYSYHLYNNEWVNPISYAIETGINDLIIDHNYFGGPMNYPLASFPEDQTYYGLTVYNNVFHNGGIQATAALHLKGGINELKFYNNTLVTNSDKTFIYLNDKAANNSQVKNNIFVGTGANTVISSSPTPPVISHNLFYNVKKPDYATNSIINNPQLNLSGSVSNYSTYFGLKSSSPAINAGVVISPYTNGYKGSAPDLGAFEYGASGVVGPRN